MAGGYIVDYTGSDLYSPRQLPNSRVLELHVKLVKSGFLCMKVLLSIKIHFVFSNSAVSIQLSDSAERWVKAQVNRKAPGGALTGLLSVERSSRLPEYITFVNYSSAMAKTHYNIAGRLEPSSQAFLIRAVVSDSWGTHTCNETVSAPNKMTRKFKSYWLIEPLMIAQHVWQDPWSQRMLKRDMGITTLPGTEYVLVNTAFILPTGKCQFELVSVPFWGAEAFHNIIILRAGRFMSDSRVEGAEFYVEPCSDYPLSSRPGFSNSALCHNAQSTSPPSSRCGKWPWKIHLVQRLG